LANRRVSLGHTQQSLGEELSVAAETIAAWERGTRMPHPRYRPELARVLQMTPTDVDRMIDPDTPPIELNGHPVPSWLSHYESLIEAAGWLGEVESVSIPGLLQTRAYAEAVERATEHPFTDEQVRERVELRLTRQRALHRATDPLHLTTVLPEHLLRAVVGGRETMGDQLDHLVELQQLPNVELRVLPADDRATAIVNGFELLARRGDTVPFMAVAPAVAAPHYGEDPDLVRKYVTKFDHLVKSALTPSESTRHILDIRESFR
jgi:transcriptional regulator with XRE-family HTH domain